jgi:hypothetical protein
MRKLRSLFILTTVSARQTKTLLLHLSYLIKNFKVPNMKEHIHLKISASDKQELTHKAKELGLSLSGYIRLRLSNNYSQREITLRGVVLNQ